MKNDLSYLEKKQVSLYSKYINIKQVFEIFSLRNAVK